MDKIVVSGKRKTAIARAVISEGHGRITINKKNPNTFHRFDKLKIEEPLRIAKQILGELKFNVEIEVKGGGEKGQVEAARVALSRAIVKFSKSKVLEDAYYDYDRNMLVADVRRKEAYKPGDSKARAKRQTSYR
jgi:small subunit ribosomal protein S9